MLLACVASWSSEAGRSRSHFSKKVPRGVIALSNIGSRIYTRGVRQATPGGKGRGVIALSNIGSRIYTKDG